MSVTIPRGAGKPPHVEGGASYAVRITRSANYRIWLRTLWTDGDGNSFAVAAPGCKPETIGQDGTYGRWHWVSGPEVALRPGNHSLHVLHREDGVSLDRILLVPDPEYVPRGPKGLHVPSGWADSDLYFADDFSRTSEAPSNIWQTVSGKWGIRYTLDPNKLPDFYSYLGEADQQGLVVTGHRFWRDYQITAAIKPSGCRSSGLVFGYVDSRHYYLAGWTRTTRTGSHLELARVAGGKKEILGKTPLPRLEGVWSQLTVKAWGNEVTVIADGLTVLKKEGIQLSGGKAGLQVSGGKAAFDNVEVTPVRLFRADYSENPEWWDVMQGKWGRQRGAFSAQGTPQAIALTGKADWCDYEVRAQVQSNGRPFGIITCWQSPDDYYAFESSGEAHAIVRVKDAERSTLAYARKAVSGDGWQSFSLRRVGAFLAVFAGNEKLFEAWDDSMTPGRPGLAVGSDREVVFRGLEVEFLEPRAYSEDVESFTFVSPHVVDPTDMPDWTAEQAEEVSSSDVLRRQVRRFPLVGPPHSGPFWSILSGRWAVEEEMLQAMPGGPQDRSILLYNRQLPGDAVVKAAAERGEKSTGDWGLLIHGLRSEPLKGYQLVLCGDAEKRVVLYRAQREVASAPVPEEGDQNTLDLWRSGDHVLGWLNGRLLISYQAPEPPKGELAGIIASRGPVCFQSATLSSLSYSGRKWFYPFAGPETDWLPAAGAFSLHGGVSCLLSSSWLSILGDRSNALMWHKKRFEGDLSISYRAMEHSIWYGWKKTPSHIHTAYKNIGISLCSDGRDVSSGYAVIVNGWNVQHSAILRKGKVVARLAQGPGFPCQYGGGHAPISPRTSDLRVSLRGGDLTLWVNGVPVLSYTDPQPLKEGTVALWNWNARMNLGHLHVSADASRPRGRDELASSVLAGDGGVGVLVDSVRRALGRGR